VVVQLSSVQFGGVFWLFLVVLRIQLSSVQFSSAGLFLVVVRGAALRG
jgi:hypothetical protein